MRTVLGCARRGAEWVRRRPLAAMSPSVLLALLGAALAVTGQTRWALVCLTFSAAFAFSTLAVVLQQVHEAVHRLAASDEVHRSQREVLRIARQQGRDLASMRKRAAKGARATADSIDGVSRRLGALAVAQAETKGVVVDHRGRLHELTGRIVRDGQRYRTTLDSLPSDVLRLSRTFDELVGSERTLPGLGGWAVTPATMMTMLDEVRGRAARMTILECGSGKSTLLFALALRREGNPGHVFALESDPGFAEQTRVMLSEHDVADLATVLDAPLVEIEVPGAGPSPWFDLTALPDELEVDLLFVDAPVGASVTAARYPAFPVLASHLAAGSLVVLDDTDREDESAAAASWAGEQHDGVRLVRLSDNVRSTFFRASREWEDR